MSMREDLEKEFELTTSMAGLLPTFDNPYVIDDKRIAVAADIHLPAHDPKLVARFVESAINMHATRIVLAGDVMDMQYFSRFGIDDPSTTFRQELDIAGNMIRSMTKYAPVLWSVGNHEDRLFRGRPLDMELLARMAGLTDELEAGILVVSDHPTIRATVGNWIITHPAVYGSVPLVVPSKLATRYQANVIAGHEHHWGMTTDETGQFYAISTGGLYNPARVSYINKNVSAHRAWGRGWVTLVDGEPTLHRG